MGQGRALEDFSKKPEQRTAVNAPLDAGACLDRFDVGPPQIAVALHFDPTVDGAPRVVASGRGAVADQILNLAFAHGVKVRTDADLAQVLAAVEVDTVIPLEAFAAVAEILAYVYQCNDRAKLDLIQAQAAAGAP